MSFISHSPQCELLQVYTRDSSNYVKLVALEALHKLFELVGREISADILEPQPLFRLLCREFVRFKTSQGGLYSFPSFLFGLVCREGIYIQ